MIVEVRQSSKLSLGTSQQFSVGRREEGFSFMIINVIAMKVESMG